MSVRGNYWTSYDTSAVKVLKNDMDKKDYAKLVYLAILF